MMHMNKKFIKAAVIGLVWLVAFNQLLAQETNEANLKNLLTSKNFIFKAQSAWPLQGTVVQLNAGYDMRVLPDSINTYLPYFGRAYTPSFNSEGGISFTSKKFDYIIKEMSKGGWEITIKPSDTKDVTQ